MLSTAPAQVEPISRGQAHLSSLAKEAVLPEGPPQPSPRPSLCCLVCGVLTGLCLQGAPEPQKFRAHPKPQGSVGEPARLGMERI